MDALHIVELFREVAASIQHRIAQIDHWGPSGLRPGQYTIDVSADEVAVARLLDAGCAVLSEESGHTGSDRDLLVVVDPIDGSTNAAAGLPWFGTSLCALDDFGPLASLVVNQATGTTWHAVRGGGAFRDGLPIEPSAVQDIGSAFVAVSGLPARHFGWRQFRCYGAAALDLCSVADGTFDGFADLSFDAHGAWDYMGALLVCQEAGATVVDVIGRDLVVREHGLRRTPIAGSTPALCDQLVAAAEATRAAP